MKKTYVLLGLVIILLVIAWGIYNWSRQESDVLGIQAKSAEPPLLLKSIGITLDTYNPKTKRAGDIVFTDMKLQFGKVWMDYGFTIPASPGKPAKRNPQPTFILPLGTKVRSLVDGVVVGIPKLYSGDYSIQVASNMNSQFRYETEHVVNPLVKIGDKVKAGQVIASVSDYDSRHTPGFGLVEIGILKGGNPPQHLCPFQYLDPSIKDDIQKKIVGLYKSWESYKGDKKFYNEAAYPIPGCETLAPIEG